MKQSIISFTLTHVFTRVQKTIKMKQAANFFILIALLFLGVRPMEAQQKCEDFESYPINNSGVSNVGNWVMYNDDQGTVTSPSNIKIRPGGGNGNISKVITASDAWGSTHLVNATDYSGDWIAKGYKCFCFDLKLISDGDPGTLPPVKHGIDIYQKLNLTGALTASNPLIRFQFALNQSYDENTPWQRICLPIQLINPGDPLPSNNFGHWVAGNLGSHTGISKVEDAWNDIMHNVTAIGFFVDVTSANRGEVIGVDNVCLGCDQPANNTCCTELTNLIINSDFGNRRPPLGFTSQYTYDAGLPALSSLLPGEFAITDAAGAKAICPNWNIKDHTTCPTNGNGTFMVVNGSTGKTGKKLVWEETLNNVPGGKEYKFCAQFKNLLECCFDVKPKIDILFVGVTGHDLLNQTISITSTGNCGWLEIKNNIWLTNTTNLKIQIWLDETAIGDGNDLAIDDIGFYALPPIGVASTFFTVGLPLPHQNGGSFYQIIFTSPPLSSDCHCNWKVCVVDPITNQCTAGSIVNDPLWWALPTYCTSINFPGYNGSTNVLGNLAVPGAFDITKTYRITREAWCECKGWGSTSYDLFVKNKVLIVRDSETKKILQELAFANK